MAKKLSEYKVLVDFIKKYDCFEIHNNVLFCNACNEIKNYNPNEGLRSLKQHISSKKHLKSVELKRT